MNDKVPDEESNVEDQDNNDQKVGKETNWDGLPNEDMNNAGAGGEVASEPDGKALQVATDAQTSLVIKNQAMRQAATERDIVYWLESDVLPEDVHAKLAAAAGAERPHPRLPEIALTLSALRREGFSDDDLQITVATTADRAVERWRSKRTGQAASGVPKVTDNVNDHAKVPLQAFVTNLLETLGWALKDARQCPVSPTTQATALRPRVANSVTTVLSRRDRIIAAWEAKPTYTLRGTIFSQSHAAKFARQYPDLPIEAIEIILSKASMGVSGVGHRPLHEALEEASRQIAARVVTKD